MTIVDKIKSPRSIRNAAIVAGLAIGATFLYDKGYHNGVFDKEVGFASLHDVDNDGIKDLVVCTKSLLEDTLSVYKGERDGTFSECMVVDKTLLDKIKSTVADKIHSKYLSPKKVEPAP